MEKPKFHPRGVICNVDLHYNQWLLKEYEDNHNILAIEHVRDTDLNKSSDFLLNPVCIMLIYIIIVLHCKYLSIVQMQ